MSSHLAATLVGMSDAAPSTRYGHLAAVLRDQIRQGRYRVGDELPSIAAIADEAAVSHMTVKQALRMLSDEGVVSTRRGARARVVTMPGSVTAPLAAQLHELQTRVDRLEHRTQALERHATKTTGRSRAKP